MQNQGARHFDTILPRCYYFKKNTRNLDYVSALLTYFEIIHHQCDLPFIDLTNQIHSGRADNNRLVDARMMQNIYSTSHISYLT